MSELQSYRKRQGLTQQEMMALTGWSQSRICRIERTPLESLQFETVRKYMRALGGDAHWMLEAPKS